VGAGSFRVANLVGYQGLWLACVAGAGSGRAWLAPVAAAAFALLVLRWGGKARQDLHMLLVALPLGVAFDSALAAAGWLAYASPWPSASLAPAWIWSLWLGFALTLNHTLAFLRTRPMAAALFGLVGGPLAYAAAASGFDAVVFAAPVAWTLGVLALGWAVLLPVLFAAGSWLSRADHRGEHGAVA